MTLISVKKLNISTPTGRVLSTGVEFDLKENEILVIRGENGVGKTTLLRTLLKPKKSAAKSIKLCFDKRKLDYLPQVQSSNFHIPMTIKDALSLTARGRSDINKAMSFGLLEERHLGLHWNTASGGEQKRVLLTRSLLKDPDVLMLDEPLNHLDALSRDKICDALNAFVSRPNKAIIMVSHDLESISHYAGAKLRFLEIKR